jgi:shikimate dehydrogenase
MITEKFAGPLLAGVIGDPITHSKSPKLHNYWLNQYNIEGFYIPVKVSALNLKQSVDSLINLGFRGINVTIPHKVTILSLADKVTDRASVIGAANTLYFSSTGKITADNTDGYGFKTNIYHHHNQWRPENGPAVVFGAGGAAKAIVYTLLAEGVPKVKLLNRTKVKAQLIADNLGNKVEVYDWYASAEALKGATTVVNTTSMGMIGQPNFEPLLINLEPTALVTDLVYAPIETSFLLSAKKAGYKTVDGLGMLLYQAEIGFTNWFNYRPEINDNLKAFMLKNNSEV